MFAWRRIAAALAAALVLFLWGARSGVGAAEAVSPEGALTAGLLACHEVIDLAGWGLSTEGLVGVYAAVLQGTPELFHVAPRLSYSTREGVVGEVYPVYTLTGEALTAARGFYRDTVSAILAEMERDFGGRVPTEAEIVLYLHDYLADRYAYDTRESGQNADAYTFLRDGVGICQAYALAFMALARGAGLEADFVASAAMDHAWNHVRVEGGWYHVDVTRDDPIPADEGREEVNHNRILRSDEGMEALGYHGFSCSAGHICDDTRYESHGDAALGVFREALIPFGNGFLGDSDGAPVAVAVGKEGFSTGQRGDVDGDEKITPADLLIIYGGGDGDLAEWREWVRGELVK